MNVEIKEKWLNALKSGEYEKRTGYLRKDNQFCCLGVLCDLYNKETGKGKWRKNNFYLRLDNSSVILPTEVYQWAGLLWKSYGSAYIDACIGITSYNAQIHQIIDEEIIQGIDAHDSDNKYYHEAFCGAGEVKVLSLSNIITNFNYSDVSDHEMQKMNFIEARDLIIRILDNKIKLTEKYLKSIENFNSLFTVDGNIGILSKYCNYTKKVHTDYPDIYYVIHPSNHPGGLYSMVAIPKKLGRREVKLPIERPEWFKEFIHNGKWIAGSNTVEELIKLAKFNIDEI